MQCTALSINGRRMASTLAGEPAALPVYCIAVMQFLIDAACLVNIATTFGDTVFRATGAKNAVLSSNKTSEAYVNARFR